MLNRFMSTWIIAGILVFAMLLFSFLPSDTVSEEYNAVDYSIGLEQDELFKNQSY